MKRKWLFGSVGAFLWLAGQVFNAQAVDPAHFQAANLIRLPDAPAVPDLSLLDLEGQEVSFSMFRGKIVLLNFWTTW
ncbi:MAG: hypothetical protein ACE5JS_11370 [Nitrospinota bacterium]